MDIGAHIQLIEYQYLKEDKENQTEETQYPVNCLHLLLHFQWFLFLHALFHLPHTHILRR